MAAQRRRRRSGTLSFVFLAVLAVVAGTAVAMWRGVGPFPDPPGCTADVAGQQVGLDPEQGANAALIAAIGVQRGLPARAVSIALATAFQESKIRNLPGGDLDSIGIFQQRPSQGWGTVAQIRNVHYSINAFYNALEKVDGYQTMEITVAAQKVQRSGYPDAYQQHAADARALASALTGYSPGGRFTCVVADSTARGTAAEVTRSLTGAFGRLAISRTGVRQDLQIDVGTSLDGNRTGWAVAQYLVAYAGPLHLHTVSFDGKTWTTGRASEKGWTRSGSSPTKVVVSLG